MTADGVGHETLPRDSDSPGTIRVSGVSRWFGNVVAVNGISFEVGPGITGLLGPNGAGKSTLLHMLSGFLKPSAGEVAVLNQPVWENPDIYRSLGLVQEREAVYSFLTGFQYVLLGARLQGLVDAEAATRRALKIVDLEDVQDRPAGTYSKGMRQRLRVAGAIVHDPPILLLDEPFTGTDPRQRLHLMGLLREMAAEGRTILFSSHILEEVEQLAENILVIVAGRLAASGNFHDIRRLMTDRPHTFTIRCSDSRRLASKLLEEPVVIGVQIEGENLVAKAATFAAFGVTAPRVASEAGVTLYEFVPTDESLETVFSYLVQK
jgi:ABC-2 type transport system ATP-binding protein